MKFIQTGIQLHIEAFTVPEKKLNIGTDWEEWLEIFEDVLQLQKAEHVGDKLICLRRYGGKEIRRLVKHLPTPKEIENGTEFKKAVRKVNTHFIPKKNKQHAWYQFNQEKVQVGETITSY